MSTELRPTPETDAEEDKRGNGNAMHAHCHDSSHLSGDFADFARKLERERDSAKSLNKTLLDQLEAQAVQIEAMRDAIKDAHYALAYVYNHGEGSCTFPYRTEDDLCSENRFHHVKDALDALQPFLKP